MNAVRIGLHLAAAVLLGWPSWLLAQGQALKHGEASLVGSWLVTVEGESATRTLIISEVAPTPAGALFSAKYGMTAGGQSPIDAKLVRAGELRQMNLVTQAATIITATEQPDGSFKGTFALKSGVVKSVSITRASEKEPQGQAPPKDLTAFIPIAPDVSSECAALHGTWLGVWVQGGYGEMFLRVVEVTTKDGVCSARLSYSPSKTPVPAREVVAVKGGMLSFPCSRSRSGTCSLKRTGDDLWASYSDPSGGTNSAVFRKVAPQAK